jgi:hypothetical protein
MRCRVIALCWIDARVPKLLRYAPKTTTTESPEAKTDVKWVEARDNGTHDREAEI